MSKTWKRLRAFRRVVSVFILLAFLLLFLDFTGFFQDSPLQYILYSQFIPVFLKMVGLGILLAIISFVILLALVLVTGRTYCSFLCPLGILQDAGIRLGKKLKIFKRFRYQKPKNLLRYSLLGVVVISLIFGSVFFTNLLDPYSNFGRISTALFKPVVLETNNIMAHLLGKVDVYSLYHIDIKPIHLFSLFFSSAVLLLVGFLSLTRGRRYCNTICPVGTFMGLVSSRTAMKVQFDNKACNSCGSCMFACKAECIDIKTKTIDHSRCVACFNCLTACDKSGLHYGFQKMEKPVSTPKNPLRRVALQKSLGVIFASLIASRLKSEVVPTKKTTIPEEKEFTVSPPGSLEIDRFNDYCTACHLCVSACPTGVLRPSFLQYGLQGLNQPFMDFHTNYCNFECTLCGEICPTGAIKPITVEEKKTTQMGKVVFIKENCVVYTENTACGSCSEHCPTQAVKMVPYKDNLTIPEIDPNICVGCGACEYACPTRPYRAIYVDGNNIHQVALKPEIEKATAPDTEDFPF